MGRLVVVLTSPRLPAGLLTRDAWRALEGADLILAATRGGALASALTSAGLEVQEMAEASAAALVALADQRDVVWLAADDGDAALTGQLADLVVRRSETGAAGPEVEILLGSYDPVGARLLDVVAVMDRLRRECPWDQEQTHESLVPYLVEESYEVIEAIEGGDRQQLAEELGDLLLQVVFHARMALDDPDQPFSIDDVAGGLVDKLVRRHPHVFSDVVVSGRAEVESNWEQIKLREKARVSVFDGIPAGLPALRLADTVVDRALRARGAAALSVPSPEAADGSAYTEETLGEELFALVAAARAGGLDAEQALRARVRQEVAALRESEQRAAATNGRSPR
jgi:NTP pyrophosphatase (non-canonical NTP hydrolase)